MKCLRCSKGFTLIEMFIALVILSLAMLALAGLMVATTKNNSFGGHVTEAATFAQEKLEEFRTISWDSIVTGFDQRIGLNGINFQRNWNVVTSPDGNLKTVTLTVNWVDRNSHSIRLENRLLKKNRKAG